MNLSNIPLPNDTLDYLNKIVDRQLNNPQPPLNNGFKRIDEMLRTQLGNLKRELQRTDTEQPLDRETPYQLVINSILREKLIDRNTIEREQKWKYITSLTAGVLIIATNLINYFITKST